jgi:lipopolysaccharide export system permease protein
LPEALVMVIWPFYSLALRMLLKYYLLKQIMRYAAAMVLVLLVIFSGVEFSTIMRSAIASSVPHSFLGKALVLQMPFLLSLLLPLAILLAGILVMNNLQERGELTVVKAIGVDNVQIHVWILQVAVIFCLVVATTSLYLEPKASKIRNHLFHNLDKDYAFSHFQPGQFYPLLQGNAVIFVGKSQGAESGFQEIFIAYNEPHKTNRPKWTIVSAEEAHKQVDKAKAWSLHNAWSFSVEPGAQTGEMIHANTFTVQFPDAAKAELAKATLEEMTVKKLWQQPHNPLAQSLLQWRLSLPLSVFILALCIIPFSYERVFSTHFLRLFAAVTLYAVYLSGVLIARYQVSIGALSLGSGVLVTPVFFGVLLALYHSKERIATVWRRVWP